MSIRDRVGEESVLHRKRVTAEEIKAFAAAVRSTVQGEAPPTYMTTLRKGEFELFVKLGIPLPSILHAEQEYTYEGGGMPVGCEVEFKSSFKTFNQKRGSSALSFLAFETEVFRVEPGPRERVGTSLTTIVVRGELQ
ncbi:MAG TPA: MaoC family dehydratase N-terminal domain-containing protein [Bdellovibrionota bacterium]|nr:MaoC family dehydratase N-terminal domain-containing protein [Bdellovibrionota bacterium]